MSRDAFRGVFPILSTPFAKNGDADWGDLERVVDFCVACGSHGIVWPVNASSFPVLTDEERMRGMQVVIEQTAGRVPVILGVQGASGHHAALFSRHAQELGADGVIAMAPYVEAIEDEDAMVHYFQAIDREVNMPIFIQNHIRGSELSIDAMARLIREVEHIEYVKEESFPATHMTTGLIERAGPKLKGVFGGASGRYLLLEHPRGGAGQMPGCHIPDVVVRLWNALEAGDLTEAKRVYGIMAPLFALETLKGTTYPEILRRRQVITSSHSRLTTHFPMQDAYDHAALDDILRDLQPLFTWNEKPLLFGR